ncbi:hypothetical protein [uncultured Draconibacterium sp.]|uniref:hypothetical protein n=1 Tax=uncultured Draconibacterium sp. TaxID=1573823 RepID=UPI0029C9271C|nr:hypothetical protein [uncultured Draconibacterium sp.]
MDYIIISKCPQGEAFIEESQRSNCLDENICNKNEYVEIEKICSLTLEEENVEAIAWRAIKRSGYSQEKTKIFKSTVYLQMYTVFFPTGKMNNRELPDYLGDAKFRNKNSVTM